MKRYLFPLLILLFTSPVFSQLQVKMAASEFMQRTAIVLNEAHKLLIHQDSLALTGDFSRSVAMQRNARDLYELANYYDAIKYSYYAREAAFLVCAKSNKRLERRISNYTESEKKHINNFPFPNVANEFKSDRFNYQTDLSFKYDTKLEKIDVNDIR